jgi:hypothetical protein
MSRWYSKITSNPTNYFAPLGEAIEYFYGEYEEASKELRPARGDSIDEKARNMAGTVEYRYGQLQELEAILKFLEIQYDKVKGMHKRNFYEHYNRQLSERLADQYADIEPDVVIIREFIQQTALIRNMFLGVHKGLEILHYQIGHIIALRKGGIEDATF